jgi:hypothetical protein
MRADRREKISGPQQDRLTAGSHVIASDWPRSISPTGAATRTAKPPPCPGQRRIEPTTFRVFPVLSAGLRYVVDHAFPYIRQTSGGGREVLIVVEHYQVMLGCGGADQQIHGR